MGIYDREYYREEDEQRWQKSTAPMTMVGWIIVVNVVLYLANMFFSAENWLTDSLAMHANLFREPWNFWQLVTSGFAHAPINKPTGILHIVMNMYILYMFGRPIEEKYGRFEFLWMYLAAIVVSGLGWVGMQALFGNPEAKAYGASGGVTAVVILFCLNYPHKTLLLMGIVAIPAWVLGMVFIGTDILHALGATNDNVAWEAHMSGAMFGFLYFRLGFRFDRFLPSNFKGWNSVLKRKPKFRVIDADVEDDERYQKLDEQADRLLDKVHRVGQENLTAKERRILEDYSRRMRQKHK